MILALVPFILAASWAIADDSLPKAATEDTIHEAEMRVIQAAVNAQNLPGPTSNPLIEPSQRSLPLAQEDALIPEPVSASIGQNTPTRGRSLRKYSMGNSVDPYLCTNRDPTSNGSNPNDCAPSCSYVSTPPENYDQWSPATDGSLVQPIETLDEDPPSNALPLKRSTFFVTITRPPATRTTLDVTTVTRAITIVASQSLPSPTLASNKDEWFAPPDFDSLGCFNILKYGFGKSNLKVVRGIPAEASATALAPVPTGRMDWTNEMSALEVFYPEGSINPGNSPQGGADFYASPLPALAKGQNVTLGYSVFMPLDFEPMRGGKLPGLYGGKMGCSGGDAALDCFSTRLMWRADYEGELYLYAPKDKQTTEVCNTPPRSICEADYGLSIGRGSFKFVPGQWTHVSQTVVLNTPGEQDGHFTLDVNGERIMDLSGLYYRQNGPADWSSGDETEDEDADNADVDNENENATGIGPEDSSEQRIGNLTPDGELEELLGHVLIAPPRATDLPRANSSNTVAWKSPGRFPVFLATPAELQRGIRQSNFLPSCPDPPTITRVIKPVAITVASQTIRTPLSIANQIQATERARPSAGSLGINLVAKNKIPGFSGIFFSTFFGGHTPNFATPKDQKIWFKDFSLVVND